MYTHYGHVGAIPTQRVYRLSDTLQNNVRQHIQCTMLHAVILRAALCTKKMHGWGYLCSDCIISFGCTLPSLHLVSMIFGTAITTFFEHFSICMAVCKQGRAQKDYTSNPIMIPTSFFLKLFPVSIWQSIEGCPAKMDVHGWGYCSLSTLCIHIYLVCVLLVLPSLHIPQNFLNTCIRESVDYVGMAPTRPQCVYIGKPS